MSKPLYPPKPRRCLTRAGYPTKWYLRWLAACAIIDAEHRAHLLSILKSRARIQYTSVPGNSITWIEKYKVKR